MFKNKRCQTPSAHRTPHTIKLLIHSTSNSTACPKISHDHTKTTPCIALIGFCSPSPQKPSCCYTTSVHKTWTQKSVPVQQKQATTLEHVAH